MEAVLDTNVVISAALGPKGPPAEIVRAWRANSFVWVTSPALLQELDRVIHSRHIKRYLAWDEQRIDEFLTAARQDTRLVTPKKRLSIIKTDEPDNRVREAASEAHADYIVSGDSDLLDLQSYRDAEIVTPARFLALLTAEPAPG